MAERYCEPLSPIATLNAAELVADVNVDGLPVRLLQLTEKDYVISIVTSR